MFVQGVDFTCGPVKNNYVCQPKTEACRAAIWDMQMYANQLLGLTPGVEITNSGLGPDGVVGWGTNNAVCLLGVNTNLLAPVPAQVMDVFRAGNHAQTTAHAREIADWFKYLVDNFTQLLAAYYYKIYGTGQQPAGQYSPYEEQGKKIARMVTGTNRRLFWLVVGGLTLAAGGTAAWVAYRKKRPKASRSRALKHAYA